MSFFLKDSINWGMSTSFRFMQGCADRRLISWIEQQAWLSLNCVSYHTFVQYCYSSMGHNILLFHCLLSTQTENMKNDCDRFVTQVKPALWTGFVDMNQTYEYLPNMLLATDIQIVNTLLQWASWLADRRISLIDWRRCVVSTLTFADGHRMCE